MDSKKIKYKPEDIDFMYLIPSGYDKFERGYDNMLDIAEIQKGVENSICRL
ncbi:MAG: hypothetical protein ACI86M_002935 [Saprospiraceae bacterium]